MRHSGAIVETNGQMRRRLTAIGLVAATAGLCLAEPSIPSVAVRQQWPWSTKINVDFRLVNEDATPIDVSLAITNGGRRVSVPVSAVSGPRIGLTSSGDYRLVVDPAKFGAGTPTICEDFNVTLSLSASRADADFPLYRIYNLTALTSTNVTVKALLNGEWGDVETDDSFSSGTYLPADAIIWTGVTNNPAYKTNCLVMRHVSAGIYTMLAQRSPPGTTMTLSAPFYVGVFEMTQGQCELLSPGRATACYTNGVLSAMRPMGGVSLKVVRGENSKNFPGESSPGELSYIGRLRAMTGNASFDLPTSARWEFAARAGCDARWYNGVTNVDDSVAAAAAANICRHADNGGLVGGSPPEWDAAPEHGTAVVGSYLPNAWGIYDCIGNVSELCLDRFVSAGTVVSSGPYADWLGSTSADINYRVVRGGHYAARFSSLSTDYYDQMRYDYNYTSGESVYKNMDTVGFRVVCDAETAPAYTAQTAIASASATSAEPVAFRTDDSPFWRTVAGGSVLLPIDWPVGARTATCTLSAFGRTVAAQTATRGDEASTTLPFTLPVPSIPNDERVYTAELVFSGEDGASMLESTQRAQFAVVLGQGNAVAIGVRAPDGALWREYYGTHITLPVAAGTTSLAIDGTIIDPLLDGSTGWCGVEVRTGAHTLYSSLEGARSVSCKGLGFWLIFR